MLYFILSRWRTCSLFLLVQRVVMHGNNNNKSHYAVCLFYIYSLAAFLFKNSSNNMNFPASYYRYYYSIYFSLLFHTLFVAADLLALIGCVNNLLYTNIHIYLCMCMCTYVCIFLYFCCTSCSLNCFALHFYFHLPLLFVLFVCFY